MDAKQPYVAPFIRERMKGFTEEEIREASDRLRLFLKIILDLRRSALDRAHRESAGLEERARFEP